MTSHAFYPRQPSASASSQVVDISQLHMFLAQPGTEPFDTPKTLYSLDELASHLGIEGSFDRNLSIQKQNAQLATKCVEAACNKKFYIENDREVTNLEGLKISSLSSLVASSHERADVIVYDEQHKKLLLLIEVQSSPMVYSERKAVIGAANALRFLRNSDSSFEEFNSFVFPKKGEKQSVMKVTVTWMNFHFRYNLKRLPNLEEVVKEIKSVIDIQSDRVPVLPHEVDPFWMCLSQDDIRQLSSKTTAQVVPSFNHIIIDDSDTMYKLVYDKEEESALDRLYYRAASTSLNPCHFIVPEPGRGPHEFKYSKVRYGPLTAEDAGKCLYTLLMKINTALEQLHRFGFAHNDVRLENICFSKELNAVLIDLERCTRLDIDSVHPLFGASSSCMYQFPRGADYSFTGRKSDYLQLGWLVTWVLHRSDSYHQREFDQLPEDLRNDPFILDLIQNGEYCQKKLNESRIIRRTTEDDFTALFS